MDSVGSPSQNVKESDGTVILTLRPGLKGGSKRTAEFAVQHCKPWLHVWREAPIEFTLAALRSFIEEHGIKVLNVAGSRTSKEPEVGGHVLAVLSAALSPTQSS